MFDSKRGYGRLSPPCSPRGDHSWPVTGNAGALSEGGQTRPRQLASARTAVSCCSSITHGAWRGGGFMASRIAAGDIVGPQRPSAEPLRERWSRCAADGRTSCLPLLSVAATAARRPTHAAAPRVAVCWLGCGTVDALIARGLLRLLGGKPLRARSAVCASAGCMVAWLLNAMQVQVDWHQLALARSYRAGG